jgi:hypothetical protein
VFSLLAGAIYYQVNLRLAIRPSLYFIQKNILTRLIAIYGKAVTPSQEAFLKKDRKYLHVFYRLTDSDESLKKKDQ